VRGPVGVLHSMPQLPDFSGEGIDTFQGVLEFPLCCRQSSFKFFGADLDPLSMSTLIFSQSGGLELWRLTRDPEFVGMALWGNFSRHFG
jgi:hypothetical protein